MNLLIDFCVGLTLSCGLISVGVLVFGAVFFRPRKLAPDLRDLFIVAAHQDDGVIVAGEYAIEAAAAGRSITVAWLTAGDPVVDSVRATTRRNEARRVWESLGVAPDQLHFLDLPAAERVEGPIQMTDRQIEQARRQLDRLVRQLPSSSAIVIPAAGESHVDHQALHRIMLDVLSDTERTDCVVYEAAEYNTSYSLLNGPARALHYLAGCLPLIGRCLKPGELAPRAHCIGIGRTWELPADANRLRRKQQMLRQFESEDGSLLVHYFGHPDRLRRITRKQLIRRQRRFRPTPRGHHPGISVRIAWGTLLGTVFLFSYRSCAAILGTDAGVAAMVCVGMAALAVSAFAVVRPLSRERRLTYMLLVAGMVAALVVTQVPPSESSL